MQSTFTLEAWNFILRVWLDESYPLDQGKSLSLSNRVAEPVVCLSLWQA